MSSEMSAVSGLMRKAEQALDDAAAALDEERWDTVVNRAYYAAFRAASALLATRDLAFSKHGAVIAEFNRLFVNAEVVPRHLGRDLNRLFKLRQRADYDYRHDTNKRTATEAYEMARETVQAVREAIDVAEGRNGTAT